MPKEVCRYGPGLQKAYSLMVAGQVDTFDLQLEWLLQSQRNLNLNHMNCLSYGKFHLSFLSLFPHLKNGSNTAYLIGLLELTLQLVNIL